MTKTTTVHAQQKWENMSITRKSEGFLVHDLNDLGQQGWELASVDYMKDIKGVMVWTAFLKRPCSETSIQPDKTTSAASSAPTPTPESESVVETPKAMDGFDLSGDEFEIHTEKEETKPLAEQTTQEKDE